MMVCARESRIVPVEQLIGLGADINAKTKVRLELGSPSKSKSKQIYKKS